MIYDSVGKINSFIMKHSLYLKVANMTLKFMY